LFTQAERVGAVGTIDREYPVQVVDLVLQQLGAIALELDLMGVSLEILIADPNVIRPLHPDQQVGEGEAVVPHREVLGPDIDDLGIDQGPGLIHFNVDDPNRRTDLRASDGTTATKTGLPISESLPQVIDDDPHGSRAGLCDELAARPKDGVAEEPDPVDG